MGIDRVEALGAVKRRMMAAARAAGRDPARVQLLAVTKSFAGEAIVPVLADGHRLFGENRVQEARAKWPALRASFADVRLHLIGPLQSNKVKEAVSLFDAIQTIDRPKIATAVAAEMARQGRRLELFIEVNTGAEPQKAGVAPGEAAALVHFCRGELGLEVAGLMCIPPADAEPAAHFTRLAALARELGLRELSMGMSADFEAAIAAGATYVRVGSLIFGERPAGIRRP
jgi:pyridoxal phosphate enzyme (YggS family)